MVEVGAASSTVTVTCTQDRRAHAVPDTELTPDALDRGRFAALCGRLIAAAPLAEPDGAPCPDCAEITRPRPGRRPRRLRLLTQSRPGLC